MDLLQGEWTLETWQERPGDVTLYMHPLRGSLFVDAFGHAYWDLDLDDGGPPPAITPRMRSVGTVDVSAESLAHWTGQLTVDGNDVIDTEYDWTKNLLSLRGDVWLAYGGAAPPGSQLFVYDTNPSDYTLTITLAADAAQTPLLTMRNAAGTFTWKKA